MLSTKNSLQIYWYRQVERKRKENNIHININQVKWEMAILISENVDFRAQKITSDWDGHYIMTNYIMIKYYQEDSNP